jgi:hypothetical protein
MANKFNGLQLNLSRNCSGQALARSLWNGAERRVSWEPVLCLAIDRFETSLRNEDLTSKPKESDYPILPCETCCCAASTGIDDDYLAVAGKELPSKILVPKRDESPHVKHRQRMPALQGTRPGPGAVQLAYI